MSDGKSNQNMNKQFALIMLSYVLSNVNPLPLNESSILKYRNIIHVEIIRQRFNFVTLSSLASVDLIICIPYYASDIQLEYHRYIDISSMQPWRVFKSKLGCCGG